MSRTRLIAATAPVTLALILGAGAASAQTVILGDTTIPSGAAAMGCPVANDGETLQAELIQTGTESAYNYAVPIGGGEITSWSFNTTDATPGTPYGLVVARNGPNGYAIVGTDTETVPPSPPAVQTYALPNPIDVQGGDVIGVLLIPSSAADCVFRGGSLTSEDETIFGETGAAIPGQVLLFAGQAVPQTLANVAASVEQSEDVGITQQALPASIPAGSGATFLLAVNRNGPSNAPVTVTDDVPSGLSITSVSAGANTCSVTGQEISCAIKSAPATIAVGVSAASPSSFANTAHVTGTFTDSNVANDSASSTLSVTPVARPLCQLVSLQGVPLPEAKSVIRILGCAVGKVTTKRSKAVPKGDVISNNPHSGTGALGEKIAIVDSSGKPKPKKLRGKRA
jgi:Domain of unknown function DUF11